MLRRTFNIATLLSLLVFMAGMAMWCRSLFVVDAWAASSGGYEHRIKSYHGGVIYRRTHDPWRGQGRLRGWNHTSWRIRGSVSESLPTRLNLVRSLPGFKYYHESFAGSTTVTVLASYWHVALPNVVLPLCWLIRAEVLRRIRLRKLRPARARARRVGTPFPR